MTITAYIPKGVIRITETVDIGSVTLVGDRDLIKAPALPALEYDIDHLHGPNPFDERTDLEPLAGSGITFMWYFVSSTILCNVYDYF